MELKIPPPLVLLICLLAQIELSDWLPIYQFGDVPTWIPVIWIGVGLLVSLMGVVAFHKAKTTINPLKPDQSCEVVTEGIYRYSRNPMYLGMLLGLMGMVFYFGEASTLFGVIFFICYITTFQIKPEEKVLREKFGEVYVCYENQTRRWL